MQVRAVVLSTLTRPAMNPKDLSKALQALAPCFKRKPRHIALTGVKLLCTRGVLYLAATDLETCKHASVRCEGEFSAVISYDFFKRLVKAMVATGVTALLVTQTEAGIRLSERSGTFYYDLASVCEPCAFPIDIVEAQPTAAVTEVAEATAAFVPNPDGFIVATAEESALVDTHTAFVAQFWNVSERSEPVTVLKPRQNRKQASKKSGKLETEQAKVIPMKKREPIASNVHAIVLTGDYETDLYVAQQLGIVASNAQPDKGLLYATIALYQGKKRLIPVVARYTKDLNAARDCGLFGLTEKPGEDDLYQAIADFNIALDELLCSAQAS